MRRQHMLGMGPWEILMNVANVLLMYVTMENINERSIF
jgi:hypothetical protein